MRNHITIFKIMFGFFKLLCFLWSNFCKIRIPCKNKLFNTTTLKWVCAMICPSSGCLPTTAT